MLRKLTQELKAIMSHILILGKLENKKQLTSHQRVLNKINRVAKHHKSINKGSEHAQAPSKLHMPRWTLKQTFRAVPT